MGDAPVVIEPYDPSWPRRFAAASSTLNTVLGPWLAGPVEHIGSTAVPGLAAKPVIDILAKVHDLRDASAAIPLLEADGWLLWRDDPYGYRLWFLTPSPANRTHHLQLIPADAPQTGALLAFRDALRADDALAANYATLKFRLAAVHRADREAYTEAKSEFVQRVLDMRA
jgi:GrpB-like predicted nucleotidyltransferase (UPF0157 family)